MRELEAPLWELESRNISKKWKKVAKKLTSRAWIPLLCITIKVLELLNDRAHKRVSEMVCLEDTGPTY